MSALEICAKRAAQPKIPEGFSVEACTTHPTYRYLLDPGARCELDDGHPGPHRAGLLVWHDPPIVVHESVLTKTADRTVTPTDR